ncbi:MAG: hydrogenobyrinic acid a,c-diamide synthase (glutamine-hydrolyzing) [Ignavibacteriaceae bacterium]|nr:hydrogenobyrinic acid a,c-diamide synthase (glutamine-hydrolyzing) [Ignavibacteriaceae bacterium]
MFSKSYPRIVISGLSGDSGKTMVSCGLLAYLKQKGMNISGFKKGPDYIDSAWLSLASGYPVRNLDTYLMGFPTAKKSFIKNAASNEISIIEGNRGLFDGADNQGTHSTAELAKMLKAPVLIVQNISKVTRTAAASILGSIKIDPDLNIAGVILNNVAGERHGKVARKAIEEITGIPVIGMIPRLPESYVLPSRHLGLITPDEFEQKSKILEDLRKVIEEHVDTSKIIEIAGNAPSLEDKETEAYSDDVHLNKEKVQIGYFKDQAFSFYYPENLESLSAAGAELIPISAIHNNDLENLDALYIGGGFPETNLTSLTLNREMMDSLKQFAEDGLPIYAECGGLIYLAEEIEWQGREFELSGVLPIKIKMHDKPQGHGYCEATVDNENPFYEKGTLIKGHEFHYSKIYEHNSDLKNSLSISRGVGCFNKRDGLTYKNVFASYIHIHALATPEWVKGMITIAGNYKQLKKTKILIEG